MAVVRIGLSRRAQITAASIFRFTAANASRPAAFSILRTLLPCAQHRAASASKTLFAAHLPLQRLLLREFVLCSGLVFPPSPVAACPGRRRLSSSFFPPPPDRLELDDDGSDDDDEEESRLPRVRLSKLIASHGQNMQMSRRSAERLIKDGMVTVAGEVIEDPGFALTVEEAAAGGGIVRVAGRHLVLPSAGPSSGKKKKGSAVSSALPYPSRDGADVPPAGGAASNFIRTRVWLAHKLPREVVTENDPHDRPSLIERLRRGGVGKRRKKTGQVVHLKPVGRLDMMTEGLVVVTNDGKYAREMELPSNGMHRTYRARVHGRITQRKLRALRNGMDVDGVRYHGMKVNIEASSGGGSRRRESAANSWLRITCTQGKNRQIRKMLDELGLTATRLIRTSFGDYRLDTIPPGMAIEVPVKPIEQQRRKGRLHREERPARQKPAEIDGEEVQQRPCSLHHALVSTEPMK